MDAHTRARTHTRTHTHTHRHVHRNHMCNRVNPTAGTLPFKDSCLGQDQDSIPMC